MEYGIAIVTFLTDYLRRSVALLAIYLMGFLSFSYNFIYFFYLLLLLSLFLGGKHSCCFPKTLPRNN